MNLSNSKSPIHLLILSTIVLSVILSQVNGKLSNLNHPSSSSLSENTSKNFKDEITKENIKSTIGKLLKDLLNNQSQEDVSFRAFPPRYSEIKGLFKSYIHLNFSDKNNWINYLLREKFKALDMNMFVTNFVVLILLETKDIGLVDFSDEVISNSFSAMYQFLDKNWDDQSPMYTFWRQKKVDDWWSCYPDTMVNLLKSQPDYKAIAGILKKLGLDDSASFLETMDLEWGIFDSAYRIPGDLDDTFTALALTSYLHKVNNTEFNEQWVDKNTNIKGLFDKIKDFAYRPFNTTEVNLNRPLDPRTYFWLHDFIIQVKKEDPNRTLILPTTWLWNWEMLNKSNDYVNIPDHVNNIDLNVAGNWLYGIISTLTYNTDYQQLKVLAQDPEIKQMIFDTIDMFIFVIKNNIANKRPDISLLYYPSTWDFYWLMSRSSYLIKSELQVLQLSGLYAAHPELDELVKNIVSFNVKIKESLEKDAMEFLDSRIKTTKDGERAYVTEFLGNFKGKERNEDALFATGLTLNSLLNIWTIKREGKVYWEQRATIQNKEQIQKMVKYLLSELNGWFWPSMEGAFFSGSVHGWYSSLIYFYPANFHKFINGTEFEGDSLDNILDINNSIGVSGYINENDFNEELNKKHYNRTVPLQPDDLNSSDFPYWSSPALTESIVILGLSKVHQILENEGFE